MTEPMDGIPSILLALKDPLLTQFIETVLNLRGAHYHLERRTEAGGALLTLPERSFSLCIFEGDRGRKDLLVHLKAARKKGLRAPVLLLSSRREQRKDMDSLHPIRRLEKPFSLSELRAALDWALPSCDASSKQCASPAQDRSRPDGALGDGILWIPEPGLPGRRIPLIARSQAMKDVLATVQAAACSDATVLLMGESGTGKSLIAKTLHALSIRRGGPFLEFTPSSVPDGLLHSELFGHVKGAFTGATEDRLGKFETADRGTLFLDEVGDLPGTTQAALLRFLQERTFERVGSSAVRRSDARIVAATHRNLLEMTAEGLFREDLFYRLSVVPIWIPPLRDHPEDIPLLAQTALRECARKHGRPIPVLETKALEFLAHYTWPGNIRQLEHTVERMVVLSPNELIRLRDLEKYLAETVGSWATGHPRRPLQRRISKEMIQKTLDETQGNAAEAARKLGISRTWLYRLKKG